MLTARIKMSGIFFQKTICQPENLHFYSVSYCSLEVAVSKYIRSSSSKQIHSAFTILTAILRRFSP